MRFCKLHVQSLVLQNEKGNKPTAVCSRAHGILLNQHDQLSPRDGAQIALLPKFPHVLSFFLNIGLLLYSF